MRILVTGSEGTLGKPLVKQLRKAGHEVWGCDLKHTSDPCYTRCNVADYRELERVIAMGWDYVYHLAAEFGRNNGEDYYHALWTSNVIGTRNVLELQRKYPFRLIFASSSEVYGETPAEYISESLTDTTPIIQHNDYATSKWVNEVQVMNFEKRHGNEVMRIRLFNAYGPGEHYHPYRSVVCLFCYRALHDMPYEVYEGYYRVFMYVDDLIDTLANCVNNYYSGEVINIGGVEYTSVKTMSDMVLDYLGVDDSRVTYLPEDRHNTVCKRPDITKARDLLGHNPTIQLAHGIPKTIEWLRSVS